MIIKFTDGTQLIDDAPESHNDWEDSYSLADVVNGILQHTQLDISDGIKKIVYNEDGEIDFVKTVGVEFIGWDRSYYTGVKNNAEVGEFIKSFHHFEHDVTATFTMGCCYWFAVIMHERFPNSTIKIAETRIRSQEEVDEMKRLGFPDFANKVEECCLHFITEIDGREYDITGDVTGKYKSVPWDEYPDGFRKQCIIEDCINKEFW